MRYGEEEQQNMQTGRRTMQGIGSFGGIASGLNTTQLIESINQEMLGAWTTISAQPTPESTGPRPGPIAARV